ncbi:MAG TPA: hypothetical protein VKI18_14030 [Albitalea sp.]|nr:hypothetical protein [Albitalea sp.]
MAALFESYRSAFERQDASAIADHYAFPMLSTIDTGKIVVTPVASKAELSAQLERLLTMYRAIGVRSARILTLSSLGFSSRLAQVSIEWEICGGGAEVLYAFQAAYTLALIDGALRITAVTHNEIPRYRECLARLEAMKL